MSLDLHPLRGHLERLVERDAELLVGHDAAELALGGLRRLLRDDSHRSREAVAGAQCGREDVEVLRQLLAELVPDAASLAPHVQVQADRGRQSDEHPDRAESDSRDDREEQSADHGDPDHPARIVLDLGDVDVVREAGHPRHRALLLLLLADSGEKRVDFLPPLARLLLGRQGDEVAEPRDAGRGSSGGSRASGW